MRILIVSKEAWRSEQNGGNVLSNIFSCFKDAEFAQIYCNEQLPNNSICRLYYQMTDKMMVNNIIRGEKVGRELIYSEAPIFTVATKESFSSFPFNMGGELRRMARELVWAIGKWDEEEILDFAHRFNPDIIFAPCYGNHYMIKLAILLHKSLKIPMISYISDDIYTNNQAKISPIFWINHFFLRRKIREVFRHYALCYAMTEEQQMQCERDFHTRMKILRKSGEFEESRKKTTVNNPIRIVYAGGIYLNRWKTLAALSRAIQSVNKNGIKMVLDIYTNNALSKRMKKAIDDGVHSRVHAAVPMDELSAIYSRSDIALHAESFDITNRHVVRMSFSTKIIDCLDSGCAVMAICDAKQAGGAYLRRNECAICVNDLSLLKSVLNSLINDPQLIVDYQHKAFEVGRKNHLQEDISKGIVSDFESLLKR